MYRQLHLQYHSTYHYILQHQCCPGYLPIVNRYLHIAPGGDDAIHGAQWSPLAVALPRRGIAQGGCGEAQLPGRPAWSHRRLVEVS